MSTAVLTVAMASTAWSQIAYDPPQPLDGIAVVIEGDRLNVNGRTVRLFGIDAPELGQTCESGRGTTYDCGAAARDRLERLIGLEPVQCSIYSKLANDDRIGVCTVAGRDLAASMVLTGWAFPVRALSSRYAVLEGRAQSRRAGMWSGRAERPWIWRRRQEMSDGR